ncbi:MAG TPA: hypothetical protein VK601_22555 [Kofleriaceae bacterium]|nr:hypothetical protein [Kofleriaceae bacterium]
MGFTRNRALWALVAMVAGSCGQVNAAIDAKEASIDSPPICSPSAKFGTPMALFGLGDGGIARLSPDELTIYYSSSSADLYVAHRTTATGAFGTPMPMMAQNTASQEYDPTVSSDGLTLWFGSNRVANEGNHLYVATRTSTLVEFDTPGLAGMLNAADVKQADAEPFVTADGNELWFISSRPGGLGGYDIWHATRTGSSFTTPALAAELNSTSDENVPMLSSDRLTVYFTSARVAPGTKGGLEVWTAHRSTVNDGFATPILVDELNTVNNDYAAWLSADNCRMYVASSDGLSSPRLAIYMATRQP